MSKIGSQRKIGPTNVISKEQRGWKVIIAPQKNQELTPWPNLQRNIIGDDRKHVCFRSTTIVWQLCLQVQRLRRMLMEVPCPDGNAGTTIPPIFLGDVPSNSPCSCHFIFFLSIPSHPCSSSPCWPRFC